MVLLDVTYLVLNFSSPKSQPPSPPHNNHLPLHGPGPPNLLLLWIINDDSNAFIPKKFDLFVSTEEWAAPRSLVESVGEQVQSDLARGAPDGVAYAGTGTKWLGAVRDEQSG